MLVDAPETRDSTLSRRADIQGLRAIAVLAVIAYHAGLPIPGGFTGVDIFFVISGFVITNMLLRERKASKLNSLKKFYARRFRRLMPALAVMVTFTVLVSTTLLSTEGPQQISAQTGLGSMLFAANIVIAYTTGNYFDAPAESNPLLHTWSLSVEEQFYFIFPALLVALWSIARLRSSKHSATLLVALISLFSFGLALIGSRGYGYLLGGNAWLLEFYSSFTRIWEFGVGALVALTGVTIGRIGRRSAMRLHAAPLAVAGAALIIVGFFSLNSSTPFPGPWTLLPVVGTLCLIVAGTSPNRISESISTKPMAKIGDWSYSLYLWHWPFIVFAILIWPGNWIAPLAAALLSFIPAIVSYYTVEQKLRSTGSVNNKGLTTTVSITFAIPIAISALVLASLTYQWIPNFQRDATVEIYSGEISFRSIEAVQAENDHPCLGFDPPNFPGRPDEQITCIQSKQDAAIDLVVVGDSHAYVLYPGFINEFPELNVAFLDAKGTPDTSNEKFTPILSYINSQPSIRSIVLSAFWELRGINSEGIAETLRSLVSKGKTPIILDDIPSFPFQPYRCKYKTTLLLDSQCTIPRQEFADTLNQYAPQIKAAVNSVPGAVFVETSDLFCNETECSMLSDGIISYADPSHVNIDGSIVITHHIINQASLLLLRGTSSDRRGSSAKYLLSREPKP